LSNFQKGTEETEQVASRTAGQRSLRVLRFELIRLYEIQDSLRQLSYFDVLGRLRLSLRLVRVTLSIPMAIDEAMMQDDSLTEMRDNGDGGDDAEQGDERPTDVTSRGVARPGGLLGRHLTGALSLAVTVLEKGERIC
jgi:hypothetical protein